MFSRYGQMAGDSNEALIWIRPAGQGGMDNGTAPKLAVDRTKGSSRPASGQVN